MTKRYFRSAIDLQDQSNKLEIGQTYDALRETENVGGQRFGLQDEEVKAPCLSHDLLFGSSEKGVFVCF